MVNQKNQLLQLCMAYTVCFRFGQNRLISHTVMHRGCIDEGYQSHTSFASWQEPMKNQAWGNWPIKTHKSQLDYRAFTEIGISPSIDKPLNACIAAANENFYGDSRTVGKMLPWCSEEWAPQKPFQDWNLFWGLMQTVETKFRCPRGWCKFRCPRRWCLIRTCTVSL